MAGTVTVVLKPYEAIALGLSRRNPNSNVLAEPLLAAAKTMRSEQPLTAASIAEKLSSALQSPDS